MKKLIFFILLSTSVVLPQTSKLLLLLSEDEYKIINMELERYEEALVTPLSNQQLARLDTWITMVKDSLGIDSLSEAFTFFRWYANENIDAARLNIVKRAHDARDTLDVVFTKWEGFQKGSGVGYIWWGFNPAQDGGNVATLISSSYGAYLRTARDANANLSVLGGYTTTNSIIQLLARNNIDRVNGTMFQSAANSVFNPTSGSTLGFFTVGRRDSTTQYTSYNSTISTVTNAPHSLPDIEGITMGRNNNGSPEGFETAQIACDYGGRGFTNAEIVKIKNCIEWYMDDLPDGKGVIP